MDIALIRDVLVYSNMYSLLAIALTLTFITTKVPNFAHGDFATVGAYAAFMFTRFIVGPFVGAAYAALPISFVSAGAVAFLSYLLVFRPLIRREASITTLMIASFGLHFVITYLLAIMADVLQNVFHVLSRNVYSSPDFYIGPMPGVVYVSTAILVAATVALYVMLNRTKFGIVMRASIDNAPLAKAIGVNVERVYAMAWFLIGGMAGVAGLIMGMIVPITEELGWLRLVNMFVAAIVGGLANVYGGILGGYVVGASSIIGSRYILQPLGLKPEFQLAIPFAIVAVVLLLAPEGLVPIISRIRLRPRR